MGGFFPPSIRVDPGATNTGPTSLLALKIRTPVANTGKLRSIGQMPVLITVNGNLLRILESSFILYGAVHLVFQHKAVSKLEYENSSFLNYLREEITNLKIKYQR